MPILQFIETITSFSPFSMFHGASLVAQSIKESDCSARDPGLIPGLGRSPGGGNGNPLQYSCLGKPTDRSGMDLTEAEDIKKK